MCIRDRGYAEMEMYSKQKKIDVGNQCSHWAVVVKKKKKTKDKIGLKISGSAIKVLAIKDGENPNIHLPAREQRLLTHIA